MRAQTRHQLKQDAFSRVTIGAAEKTAHWSVEHRNTLMIAVLVLLVIAGAGVGGWYYLSAQNEKASLDMTQAIRTLEAQIRPAGSPAQPGVPSFTSARERAEAAKKQFQTIIDKYPHTHSADVSRYFLGVTSTTEGDNAAAENDFKAVASSGDKELASIAKLALANLYGNTNRSKDAVTVYQELINKPTVSVSKVTAQLQLAELYQSSNQPLDAKRLYEQIKKDNPTTEAGQMATQKLAELK
ncbi:MAG TPA: tetratricopeptide repeat protein [Candidatus Deferrimicrobiaceae bacterium]|nr:tetratricopeptide repeat protein [Candidatus Deferrimicrobiaceae bacterium]